jgi:oligopeptide/dipeptide ABC transporter ATP-binding protein
MTAEDALLDVKNLRKFFPVRKGFTQRVVAQVKAVDNVDIFIKRGETLGLVGESGCGKTTAGRSILRLIEPTEGEILFRTKRLSRDGAERLVDMANATPDEVKVLRRDMQVIFQDPYSSLDPRMTIGQIVGEPLKVQRVAKGAEREDRVLRLLRAVGLGSDHIKRYPHEFSGGQRQRIGIARALALNPQLIVADEPVSALDVSIQAQVINLLQDLQEEFGLTYLFIAHDLSVVKHISNRVAVMYLGKVVELAATEKLFASPKHPYTEALMSAVPVANPDFQIERIPLEGDVPSPINPPLGCPFHPRCRYAESICSAEIPEYREIEDQHFVTCHLADKLNLRGIKSE